MRVLCAAPKSLTDCILKTKPNQTTKYKNTLKYLHVQKFVPPYFDMVKGVKSKYYQKSCAPIAVEEDADVSINIYI